MSAAALMVREDPTSPEASSDRLNLKYRVDRLIAEGGMGLLVRAENRVTGQAVAIKLLHPDGVKRPELLQRFEREGPLAARACHANVIRVLEVGKHDRLPYIVMEYLEGEPLSSRIARGTIPLPEAVGIVIDVLEGLAAVHRAGIIHRDIKPDNIYLERQSDGTCRAKILDFGIALDEQDLDGHNVVAGTPAFMSPEQARGSNVDTRTDIYAVGILLYEMFSGFVPYQGSTPDEVIRSSLKREHRPLHEVAPHVPVELAKIVDRAMASNPDKRFQTATEFVWALKDVLRRASGTEAGTTQSVFASYLNRFVDTYVTKGHR